ncbi:hypothetical protein BJV77DRAFT_719361 [Russula vinacea]|nr:hypothetical protein BJV77DRAFT_719361 [Russula vinacea]
MPLQHLVRQFPRLKRPSASTFEGIDIQNVVVPTKSASQSFYNRTNRPSRSYSPGDNSRDERRQGQPERNWGMRRNGGASSMSGWGDGLVSLSFSSRLKLHQQQLTGRDDGTGPAPQEDRSWKQNSNQAQRHDSRRVQEQGDDASQTHRRHGQTEKTASAPPTCNKEPEHTLLP